MAAGPIINVWLINYRTLHTAASIRGVLTQYAASPQRVQFAEPGDSLHLLHSSCTLGATSIQAEKPDMDG